MNDSTLNQLEAIVESVVRAVRVSAFRKQEIREELLTHVWAVFDEEMRVAGAEGAALQRTVERFGNLTELTHQLQESITASGFVGWLVEQAWLRVRGIAMVNHNRVYNAILIALGLYTLTGIGMLVVLMGMAPDARPRMRIPNWSLAPLAVINAFYLVAVIVTLVSRLVRPAMGRRLTRAMNLLLLIAPPFGTVLGIYGLWKVDRNLQAANS